MTAITDLSDLVNRLTGGNAGAPEHLFRWIDNRIAGAAATANVSGRFTSLWKYNSSFNSNNSNPGAVSVPTSATNGALKHTNAASGKQKWFLGLEALMRSSGTLILYDRLLHQSGLSGTTITAQTVQGDPATPALTRYNNAADCLNNQIFIEIYSQIGATGTTITARYFNENGVLSNSPLTVIGGTGVREAERVIPVPLAVGDLGVTGVKEVQLTATTGTAGDFGVTIARPLMTLGCPASVAAIRDNIAGIPSMEEIVEDACLAFAWQAIDTGAPSGFIAAHFIEK